MPELSIGERGVPPSLGPAAGRHCRTQHTDGETDDFGSGTPTIGHPALSPFSTLTWLILRTVKQ